MVSKIMQSQFRGGFALLAAAFIYGTLGIFIRAMAEMFGDNTQVAVRFGLVALVLLGLNVYQKRSLRLHRSQLRPILTFAAGTAVLVALFTYAVTTASIATAVFSLYAGSIATSLIIGTTVFGERLNTTKVAALLVSLSGITLYSGGFTELSLGLAAGFVSGILDGVTNALRKKLAGVSRLKVQMYQNGIGAIVATLLIPLFGEHIVTGNVRWWPIVATLLFVALMMVLGYLLLYGFQHFDVNAGTIILATELFFATIIGIIFFREWPPVHQLLGGCLIFAASMLTIGRPATLLRRSRNSLTTQVHTEEL